MLFSADKELFEVCSPFLFVLVVNEMDKGFDLFSWLYLKLFNYFLGHMAVTWK